MGLTQPQCSDCRHCDLLVSTTKEPADLFCLFWNQQVAEFDAEDCPAYNPAD